MIEFFVFSKIFHIYFMAHKNKCLSMPQTFVINLFLFTFFKVWSKILFSCVCHPVLLLPAPSISRVSSSSQLSFPFFSPVFSFLSWWSMREAAITETPSFSAQEAKFILAVFRMFILGLFFSSLSLLPPPLPFPPPSLRDDISAGKANGPERVLSLGGNVAAPGTG